MKVGRSIFLLFALVLILFSAEAQQRKPTKKNKPAVQKKQSVSSKKKEEKITTAPTNQKEKVREMVKFLEYLLNTLGNEGTATRNKDVIITESYLKIFRDGKVQIEDDLDEKREVTTNKDAKAYLKDVDFFFRNVTFQFKIDTIMESGRLDDALYYKVSLKRELNGITSDGKPMNNSMPRFIEVNYNPKDQDLKIVSIYTHAFDERASLQNWWNQLSLEWQKVLKQKINKQPEDSVQLADIKKITSLTELDISNNVLIRDIEPLSLLTELTVIKLSGVPVIDISPLRNHTELTELNISGTNVSDISLLKNTINLSKLNISNTSVLDISVAQKLPQLQSFSLAATRVSDISPLNGNTQLANLNLTSTQVSDVSTIASLTKLTELNLSNTPITDASALSNLTDLTIVNLDSTQLSRLPLMNKLTALKLLSINHTSVSDLSPLQNLPHLEKIYCDQSLIKQPQAEAFMNANPKVLVVYDSKDLMSWWADISDTWKEILSKASGISATPTKEELAGISKIDSLNVSDQNITDLRPLQKLPKLKILNAQKTAVTDLSPLADLKELTQLNIAKTAVKDLSAIARLPKLKIISADQSKIENIELNSLPALEKLYANETPINDASAERFLEKNPKCILIYKTERLKEWWNNLPESWKEVFYTQEGVAQNATTEQLHHLIEQTKLSGKDAALSSLSSLNEFIRIRELSLSGTALTSIEPIESLRLLKILHITGSPLMNIESIHFFTELEDLDISNTPIADIYPIWKLSKLKKLNCAGTQIKRLDALVKLDKLEYLDCSNTNVNKLESLSYLNLKTLKCFNTRISNRVIENFKAAHPSCGVMYYR